MTLSGTGLLARVTDHQRHLVVIVLLPAVEKHE